jgi:hypothetical protein
MTLSQDAADDDSITVVDELVLGGQPTATPETKEVAAIQSPPSKDTLLKEYSASPSSASTPPLGEDSQEFEMFSPATLTLNALSQNMGDLRAVEDDHSEPPKRLTIEQHPTKYVDRVAAVKNPLSLERWKTQFKDKYDWIPVRIDGPDNRILGMTLKRATFDTRKASEAELAPCYIAELKQGEAAKEQGLQTGDWLCHKKLDAADPIFATIEDVRAMATRKPFDFSVLRLKSKRHAAEAAAAAVLTVKQPQEPTYDHVHMATTDAAVQEAQTTSNSSSQGEGRRILSKKTALPKQQNDIHDNTSIRRRAIQNVDETLAIDPSLFANSKSEPPDKSLPQTRESIDNHEIPPFCRLCNNLKLYSNRVCGHSKPRAHHAWCSKNPFSSSNGSKKLLDRIQRGRRLLKCPGCETEYQTGRLEPAKSHCKLCLQNQKRNKEAIHRREEEEEQREVGQKKPQSFTKGEEQRKKRHREVVVSSREDENESLAYKSINKKKRTIDPVSKKSEDDAAICSGNVDTVDLAATGPRHAKKRPPSSSTSKVSAGNAKRCEGPRQVSPPAPAHGTATRIAPPVVVTTMVRSQPPPRRSGTFKPIWQPSAESPWGSSGFQDGDVLIFGPQRGAGHYETLLPSARFSLNPFADGSSYRSTHQHPGIIVLCLRRDPSAQTPWGFEVSRDEFGHACLVKDVQPLSPATEAVSMLNMML